MTFTSSELKKIAIVFRNLRIKTSIDGSDYDTYAGEKEI